MNKKKAGVPEEGSTIRKNDQAGGGRKAPEALAPFAFSERTSNFLDSH